MNIIFLGKKPYACKALRYTIKKNINVKYVVALHEDQSVHWSPRLVEVANEFNIPVINDVELYELIANNQINDIDYVISYLYWKKIKPSLIKLASKGCINFHPAPLPELRGLGGYNIAILEEMDYYGVSAHFINENIDEGNLIKVKRFNINAKDETAYSLEQKSQIKMFDLYKKFVKMILENKPLPNKPQEKGKYYSKKDFEKYREIKSTDSDQTIRKKIRAFWYPPYQGAFIKINGQEYTILDEVMLEKLGKKYH